MLGAVMQSQAGDREPSGGHRGIESAGADDLAAVALDAQRDTSTSTVGLGANAVARTAGRVISRTPWSYLTALGCGALLDRCRVRRTEAAAAAVAAFGRKLSPQFQLVGVSR